MLSIEGYILESLLKHRFLSSLPSQTLESLVEEVRDGQESACFHKLSGDGEAAGSETPISAALAQLSSSVGISRYLCHSLNAYFPKTIYGYAVLNIFLFLYMMMFCHL